MSVSTRRDVADAGQAIQRVLDAVDRGDLAADDAVRANIIRQLRGAVVALGLVARPRRFSH